MKRTFFTAFAVTCLLTTAASAALFDQDITPDAIFGSGNADGFWTVDQSSGVELGLRAKLRFDAANDPQNIFNSNGDGSYTFQAGLPPTGFGFAANSPSTAVWNFEWSINSDFDGSTGLNLDDLTYLIELDFDPGPGTNFLSFDPINVPSPFSADHAIGTNATGNGGGTSVSNNPIDRPAYLNLIGANNVAQNSWNLEFFDNAGGGFPFSGSQVGEYTFRLSASNASGVIAQTEILVEAIPEPSSAVITLIGLASALYRRR